MVVRWLSWVHVVVCLCCARGVFVVSVLGEGRVLTSGCGNRAESRRCVLVRGSNLVRAGRKRAAWSSFCLGLTGMTARRVCGRLAVVRVSCGWQRRQLIPGHWRIYIHRQRHSLLTRSQFVDSNTLALHSQPVGPEWPACPVLMD